MPSTPLAVLILRGRRSGGKRPPALRPGLGCLLVVGPHTVRVEVPPRLLLALTLAVTADAHPVQKVEQQHGEPCSKRGCESVRPEVPLYRQKHHDPSQDHGAAK